MLCLDDTFYLRASHFPASPYFVASGSTSREEPSEPYGDVDQLGWTAIGQYLHFLPSVDAMADQVLRELMQLSASQAIPPLITVHMRRGDFGNWTRVDNFARAVNKVRQRLEAAGGQWRGRKQDLSVVLATDGDDPAFLRKIRDQGWHLLDHVALRTIERFGVWAPVSTSHRRATTLTMQ